MGKGIGMTAADLAARYRQYAVDCIKFARAASDVSGKLSLLNMAQAWAKLAEQTEKNGEGGPVYETPLGETAT